METYFVSSELDVAAVPGALTKVKELLRGFSLNEMRDDEYKETVAAAARNWKDFAESGVGGVAALMGRPYQWRALSGDIRVEKNRHGIELFLFPASDSTAAVALGFSSTFFDALYSFRPSYESEIDDKVKRDVIAICLMMASSLSAAAFVYRPLTDSDDVVSALRLESIRDLLTVPTQGSIRQWRALIAGVRSNQVERSLVEKCWPAERLAESNSGYLVYDAIQ